MSCEYIEYSSSEIEGHWVPNVSWFRRRKEEGLKVV